MIERFTTPIDQGKLVPDGNYDMYIESVETENAAGTRLVNQLLTKEEQRLTDLSGVIQPLYETEQRRKAHMKSETLKEKAYNTLFLVLVGTVIITLILMISRNYFPILPELLVDISIILIVAGGLIWALVLYIEIIKRNKMDFEKVDYGLLIDPKDIEKENANSISNNAQEDSTLCIGGVCCKTGHYFVNNQCSKCPEGMRMNSDGNCVEAFSGNKKSIKPYFKNPSYSLKEIV